MVRAVMSADRDCGQEDQRQRGYRDDGQELGAAAIANHCISPNRTG